MYKLIIVLTIIGFLAITYITITGNGDNTIIVPFIYMGTICGIIYILIKKFHLSSILNEKDENS